MTVSKILYPLAGCRAGLNPIESLALNWVPCSPLFNYTQQHSVDFNREQLRPAMDRCPLHFEVLVLSSKPIYINPALGFTC